MSDFDVIIVGGGPAGSAAALQALKMGLRPLIIERQRFPRHRPGETLPPAIEPLLNQLGASQVLMRANFPREVGVAVEWGGNRRFEVYGQDDHGPWLGFQAWRADFDTRMLEAAQAAGAVVIQPARVKAVIWPIEAEDRRIVLQTTQGSFQAPYIVDAGGGRHWLARLRGLTIQQYSPRLLARYGYVEGESEGLLPNPVLQGNPDGWVWMAQVRPATYAWVCLNFFKMAPPTAPPELKSLQTLGKTHLADVTWREVQESAGQGYFLIGDAAAVLDPASSHGVLRAIMSGMMAIHLARQVIHGDVSPLDASVLYKEWLRDWLRRDRKVLRSHYTELGLAVDQFAV